MTASAGTGTSTDLSDNVVFLRGRLAAEPSVRVLPSGDELCPFRLTVCRSTPAGARSVSAAKVDSIDCAALAARVRRRLERATPGDLLEVEGQLQRRFWRGPAGLGSRYEVLVRSARAVRQKDATVTVTRRRSGA